MKKMLLVLVVFASIQTFYGEVFLLKDGNTIIGKIIKRDEFMTFVMTSYGELAIDNETVKTMFMTKEEYELYMEREKKSANYEAQMDEVKRLLEEKQSQPAPESKPAEPEQVVEEKPASGKLNAFNKAGIGIVTGGALFALTGAGIFIFDNIYYPEAKKEASGPDDYQLYKKLDTEDMVFFFTGIALMGAGGVAMLASIPMLVHKEKKVALHIDYTNKLSVYLSYKF